MITENGINFNSLEKEIFKICCQNGREALKTALEGYDRELAAGRDKDVYRHKGLKSTVMLNK